ncbi:MAG: hypothetical protein J2P26_09610 [Nocardiopsaceae bacterium]|nr:hypothetical protein [Nocardiopsaceae bacterium]
MPVDPKFEVPLRKMLGHATRNELQELAALAAAEGDEMYLTGLKLCVPICGYIVVEAAGRWPLESDRRAAARRAVSSPAGLPLAEHDVYAFLSRAVFGFEAIDAVFTKTEKIVQVPMFTAASLLLAHRPEDLDWSGYLDRVWGAFDATEQAPVEVLPALTYRVKADAARARQTAQQTAG